MSDRAAPDFVPRGLLAPKRQREHGDKLDSLKLLSQAISIDVYFVVGILQDASARTICDFATSLMARSVAQYADLGSLYAGKGGVVLPSTPPPPPEKVDPSSSHPSRKRPRKSSFDQGNIESICARIVEDRLALHIKGFREELKEIKKDLMDHIEGQINDACPILNTYDKEEIDDLVHETRKDGEGYTDETIKDRMDGIKVELMDYIKEGLRDTEESLVRRLKSMSWVLNTEDA
ncbi:hypothetical protein BHE90_017149 [Fusarium euwallaceae]|uniref:Uncharacterized protein n=1 Tax=Fusarium euwallaceae TaxID=1147111 RepID=A0A430KYG8_9HYPO|nr:hypothetical protein BHE90_017149 [Fusarium euwallaceae]